MAVGGREFTSDLILHPDGCIQDNWRRTQVHSLISEDIITVLDAAPEKLIIGIGVNGRMKMSKNVIEQNTQKNFLYHILEL